MLRFAGLLLLLPFATPAPLAIKPHPSVFRMANKVAVVVEGTAAADCAGVICAARKLTQ